MFKIHDGRQSFTQWDLNRKIIVEDDSITQVHFTNLLNKNALVSEVKNHLADVPNVLLQDYGTILIYGYDGNYTKYIQAFRVIRREKPEDYIYTETEVLNYNNLLERMNNIEGSIEQVVIDYLQENPPKVDLDGYATKDYVDNAIAAISAIDLSNYFTKEETNAKFATKEEIPSTSGLATEEFVNSKVNGLATEEYVNEAVAAIPQPDLSNYALKSEIPSTVGLATEEYVNEAVSAIEIPEGAGIKHITITDATELLNLEDGLYIVDGEFEVETITYQGQSFGGMLSVKQDWLNYTFIDHEACLWYNNEDETWDCDYYISDSDVENLYEQINNRVTQEEVDTAINEAIAAIEIPEVDLSGYQEKLTAGDNITIEGNVISATGGSGGGSGGNVAVDGTTIIQNEDGTISTAIGGGKTMITPASSIVLYEETNGVSLYAKNYTRIDIPTSPNYSLEDILDVNVVYDVEVDILDKNTNITTNINGKMSNVGNNLWQFSNDFHDYFSKFKPYGNYYNNYYQAWITNTTSNFVYQQHYITKFNILTPAEYAYNKVNSNFIAIDNSLKINADGKIQTKATKITTGNENDNYVIQDSNRFADNSGKLAGGSACFGYGNALSRGEGCICLGRNNTQYFSYATQLSIGGSNINECHNTFAFGVNNRVGETGQYPYTMALGYNLTNKSSYSIAIGRNNIEDTSSAYALIAGIGQDTSTNGFTLDWTGNGAFAGQVTSTGSDYAEYFEWADGNPEAEDRVGYLVALDGDKIRLAKPGDEILGVISGTVAVLGDNYEWQWQGKYLTDDYGRVIFDMVDKYEEYEGEQVYLGTFPEPRINPEWDETATYIPRAKRKEWDAVGLLGKLYVRDDGTCKPNDYIKVGADGIATVSAEKTNMRVMSRKTDNIVKVYVR